MARVLVERLTKRFAGTIAVNDLTLEVKDGEFVCFLGPSGCGKTTTLRCITGLERQDSGNIYIDDKVVNDLPPFERDIAMVFQFPVLYPGMSVWDNLAFPLKQKGLSGKEIAQKVKETLAILGLEHVSHDDPANLNAGERQRAAIGRAIVRRPKVLLLDEALTNLGTKLKVSMITELKKLHEKLHQTIVYVTHDQAEALMMADRIAIMNLGLLQQYDTPEKLYLEPANLFVAGFVGSPPMNLIEGKVDKGKNLIQIGNSSLVLPEQMVDLTRRDGAGELLVGSRAEDISVHPLCSNPGHIKGKVEVVEFSESGTILDIQLSHQVVKVVGGNTATPSSGEQVCLEFKRMYAFDKESGASILR